MRFLLFMLAGVALFAAACAPEKSPNPNRAGANPTPTVEQLIAVEPRLLLLPANEMIPGTFKAAEGSIASGQWNRSWDRDAADPGYATGASRVTATARIYLSLGDSREDFMTTGDGDGALGYVQAAVQVRGFEPSQMQISRADVGLLSVDYQSAWRVQFTRGSATETYVQYYVFMHVKNARAIIATFAQNQNGKEAPNLLEETKQIAQRQAAHLRLLPASPQVVSAATPLPAASVIPTPRPN